MRWQRAEAHCMELSNLRSETEIAKQGSEFSSNLSQDHELPGVAPDRDFLDVALGDLPLLYRTPSRWARRVMEDPESLLNDHAHLEKKAAANALELLCRWPHGETPDYWVRALTSMAAEESDHLRLVTRFMMRHGYQLSRHHKNPYAGRLHVLVRRGAGRAELADRLYVAALIEARSCERFIQLYSIGQELNSNLKPVEQEIGRLYGSLLESEVGHYRAFLRLARELRPDDHELEWKDWLSRESQIVQEIPFYSGILSGTSDL